MQQGRIAFSVLIVAALLFGCRPTLLPDANEALFRGRDGMAWGQHTPPRARPLGAKLQPAAWVALAAPVPERRAQVDGNVELGSGVRLSALASIRTESDLPIRVGDDSILADGVMIQALGDSMAWEDAYRIEGRAYAVYLGAQVELGARAQVHAPAWIEDEVSVGENALIAQAHVGAGSVIEAGAKVVGVTVPARRYIGPGEVVVTQAAAEALPEVAHGWGVDDAEAHLP